jgi:hypothetical protein
MEVSPSVVGEVQLLEAQDQEGDQQLSILQLGPLQKLFGKYPHIKELAEYSTVSMSSRSMMPIKPTHLPVTPLDLWSCCEAIILCVANPRLYITPLLPHKRSTPGCCEVRRVLHLMHLVRRVLPIMFFY